MNTEEIFNSLTKNAIDFLEASLSEIKSKPKYSVINFYAAIELFVKSRLLNEHWSLIVAKPEKAEYRRFLDGDFHSVGLDEAVQRLSNICGQNLSNDEMKCFRSIKEHRNKLVHFYNEIYSETPKETTLIEVISEQCRGWFFLHKLLSGRWKDTFNGYKSEIDRLNSLMHSYREFLEIKFREIEPEIKERISSGEVIITCIACGFDSAVEQEILGSLRDNKCLVCSASSRYLAVHCPDCGDIVNIYDLGEGICEKCGHGINIEELIDSFGDDTSTKDYFTEPTHASCSVCEGCKTVVPVGDQWLCLSCLEIHDCISQCGWCSQNITGDSDDTFLTGCMHCDGRLGWKKDD